MPSLSLPLITSSSPPSPFSLDSASPRPPLDCADTGDKGGGLYTGSSMVSIQFLHPSSPPSSQGQSSSPPAIPTTSTPYLSCALSSVARRGYLLAMSAMRSYTPLASTYSNLLIFSCLVRRDRRKMCVRARRRLRARVHRGRAYEGAGTGLPVREKERRARSNGPWCQKGLSSSEDEKGPTRESMPALMSPIESSVAEAA
mmetsp:Transcript_13591/g.39633  ORF Transcript_13591/g.39633 Transcript_13591/m.39633 type:complete len:200 (+) Transcript_13591:1328-1927(+)